jgi:zinc protease
MSDTSRALALLVAVAAIAGLLSTAGCRTATAPAAGTPGAEEAAGTPGAGGTAETGEIGGVPAIAPAEPVTVTLPDYVERTLPNGTRLLLMPKHDVPMVAFAARVPGGAVDDPPGKDGTAALVAELLTQGAGARSAQDFAEAVDGVGGNLAAAPGRESIVVSGEFLARDTDLMVELLADALRRPALAADELDKARDRAIESIAAGKDADPSNVIDTYGHAFLFGDHPYARPVDGSPAGLAEVAAGDVQAYYRSHFGGDRLILAVVGDFEAEAMASRIEAALGDWAAAEGPAPAAVTAPLPQSGRRVLLVDLPGATQVYFWIGNVGVSRTDPAQAAIDLANTVFGGRFTSLLNNALRVESGLTYGAWSTLTRYRQPGAVAMASYAETADAAKAVDMALDQLAKYRAAGMDAATLDSARSYVLGQFPLDLETDAQLAARLAEIAFYGLDRDDVDGYGSRVGAVTEADVKAEIARLLPAPEDLAFVFIGDAEQVRDVVARYGPVTEMSIEDPTFAPTGKAETEAAIGTP